MRKDFEILVNFNSVYLITRLLLSKPKSPLCVFNS